MADERRKPILGKVIISGTLECKTGLHIGMQKGDSEIGGMNNPVIRDPITNEPYIPGSSLKGKLRALLERVKDKPFDHKGAENIYRHECTDRQCEVCRLMGAAGKTEEEPESAQSERQIQPIPARVTVRDLRLTEESLQQLSEIDTGLLYTEWKSENTLDRLTSKANPRSVERVPAGAMFNFEILYTVETSVAEEIRTDLANLMQVLALLEDDALGGSGSRGYGKVRLKYKKLEGRRTAFYAGDSEASFQPKGMGKKKMVEICDEIVAHFAQ